MLRYFSLFVLFIFCALPAQAGRERLTPSQIEYISQYSSVSTHASSHTNVAPVPEPGAALAFGLGLAVVALRARKRAQ